MARFDISASASRATGLEPRMRNDEIRRELAPQVAPKKIEQTYTVPETTMKTEQSNDLPMPYQTVKWEGRRDKQGYLELYKLPAGDMGGTMEIAGINDRYHPEALREISSLPKEKREEAVAEYIQGYTAPLVSKLPKEMQPFTQDLAFNRGLGGATKYIQQGLNTLGQRVSVDGGMGPKTLDAISKVNPRALMQAASQAQLEDEYLKAEKDPNRKPLLRGLENRIRNRFAMLGSV